MNNFFDYIFIRIFIWYESFKDNASLATAKLLVVFLQVMMLSNLVAVASYFFLITNLIYKSIGLCTAIVSFFIANKRYSDKKFIDDLILKWKHENRMIKIIRGYGIVLLLIGIVVSFLLIGRSSP